MPKYTFDADGSAQHLAGVVVETSEEVADRIPGLTGGGGKAAPEKRAAPQKSTQTATRAAPQKTVTTKSTAPKTGG